jgi:stringent starvation protein B
MTSSRPYLIRALYEWILENQMTPHLLVGANHETVDVPPQHVQDGRIVLNIDPAAVQGLDLGNDRIEFSARFGGVSRQVVFPVSSVLAIYARENGHGMMFNEESGDGPEPGSPSDSTPPGAERKRPGLRVVK